jgi:uncharacterized protein YbaR (Trm112 family)
MRPPLTELLACPSCRGELTTATDSLSCTGCGRSYAMHHGVPNLLLGPPAEAEPQDPTLAQRALHSVVAVPFVYDFVQRLAGAQRIFERMRPILEQTDGAIVLDAGAGTGTVEALLPRSARYVWLDPDPQKLNGFRHKSEAPAVLGDATRIPFKDGLVDWAISIAVSRHLDDEELAGMLDELRRVVRKRLFFLGAVVTPAYASRLLWRYDRGRHPRSADSLRKQLATRFDIVSDEEFTVLHRYLLVTGS